MIDSSSPTCRKKLHDSAIRILLSDPRKDEAYLNTSKTYLDDKVSTCSNRDSHDEEHSAPQPLTFRRNIMAKAKSPVLATVSVDPVVSTTTSGTLEAGKTVTNVDGSTETFNPKPAPASTGSKKEALAKQKAEIAEQKAKAKTEKDAAKAAGQATKDAAKAEKKAAAEKAKAVRQERLESLGRKYVGPMLALADAVNTGRYVKSATGQLRSINDLAVAFDGVTPNGVIQTAKATLGLEANPYAHLNVGQQSMNLRNKLRGAITKGTVTLQAVKDYIAENKLDVSADLKAKADEKAAAKVKRDEEAKAKKEAAAKVPAKATESATESV